jgi:hypothetical protein
MMLAFHSMMNIPKMYVAPAGPLMPSTTMIATIRTVVTMRQVCDIATSRGDSNGRAK